MSESETPIVSIVIATYRRLSHLKLCIERTRAACKIPHEFVVVDGGSDDGTLDWLADQPDVRFHDERRRGGSCRAYNIGFRMARGGYVMWLNDDSYPLPGAIENAVAFLESDAASDVGLVAFYHNHNQPWNELHGIEHDGSHYGILHVRGVPYANFGLLRRDLLERLEYLDEGYRFCAWDPDLSLKVQRDAGLRVIGCRDALIRHDELMDVRKIGDAAAAEADNAALFGKWNLPEKSAYPDPAPRYQAMMRQLVLVD